MDPAKKQLYETLRQLLHDIQTELVEVRKDEYSQGQNLILEQAEASTAQLVDTLHREVVLASLTEGAVLISAPKSPSDVALLTDPATTSSGTATSLRTECHRETTPEDEGEEWEVVDDLAEGEEMDEENPTGSASSSDDSPGTPCSDYTYTECSDDESTVHSEDDNSNNTPKEQRISWKSAHVPLFVSYKVRFRNGKDIIHPAIARPWLDEDLWDDLDRICKSLSKRAPDQAEFMANAKEIWDDMTLSEIRGSRRCPAEAPSHLPYQFTDIAKPAIDKFVAKMKIKVHHYLDGQSVVYPDDWLLREVVSRASYTRYKERVRARIAREERKRKRAAERDNAREKKRQKLA